MTKMQDQSIATESRRAGVYHEDVGMGETRQVQETKEHSDAGGGAEDVSTTRGLIFPFERSEITQGGMQFAALIVAVIFGVWAIMLHRKPTRSQRTVCSRVYWPIRCHWSPCVPLESSIK